VANPVVVDASPLIALARPVICRCYARLAIPFWCLGRWRRRFNDGDRKIQPCRRWRRLPGW
jgi:hypothetical protein